MACDVQGCQALFTDPYAYAGGAVGGAVVATLTGIHNPVVGAVIGLPFGPAAVFVYNSLDMLGNTTQAKVVRAACAFFATLLLNTLFCATLGYAITLAQGTLLIVAGGVALVGALLLNR